MATNQPYNKARHSKVKSLSFENKKGSIDALELF
jgi:hypothetical protein